MSKLIKFLLVTSGLIVTGCSSGSSSSGGNSPETVSYGAFTASKSLYPPQFFYTGFNDYICPSDGTSCTFNTPGGGFVIYNLGLVEGMADTDHITINQAAYFNVELVAGSQDDFNSLVEMDGNNCNASSLSTTPRCSVTFTCNPANAGKSVSVNFQIAAPGVTAANLNNQVYTFTCN